MTAVPPLKAPELPTQLTTTVFQDARGSFRKTWHPELLARHGIRMPLAEEFYSVSERDVLRGMHFQTPPHDHEKLVYCAAGKVLDVVLDLRRLSPTYGKTWSWELSPENGHLIYIPRGFAHGFLSLLPGSVMVYKTSTLHAPDHDAGVRWDSFGFEWPVAAPILSPRDQEHPQFTAFVSPF
jgi:dTDP-4-dehydrorhamnose 3,5-epimerase